MRKGESHRSPLFIVINLEDVHRRFIDLRAHITLTLDFHFLQNLEGEHFW